MGHPKKNREKADRSDTTDPDLERNTINYRDPIRILLKEALEWQRNAMMDSFAQILQRLPKGDTSASNSYSGNATLFKVQVNFEITIFEGQIDANVIDK